jgi:hypothetical protein
VSAIVFVKQLWNVDGKFCPFLGGYVKAKSPLLNLVTIKIGTLKRGSSLSIRLNEWQLIAFIDEGEQDK